MDWEKWLEELRLSFISSYLIFITSRYDVIRHITIRIGYEAKKKKREKCEIRLRDFAIVARESGERGYRTESGE